MKCMECTKKKAQHCICASVNFAISAFIPVMHCHYSAQVHNCTSAQVHMCASAQLHNCTTARPGEARYATEFANKVFSPQNMELTEKRRRQRFFSRFWNISTIEHIAMHERGFYARCKMSDGFCYLSLFLLLECSF